MLRAAFEDLYRHAKTPAQVYGVTAIVIGFGLLGALGVLALFLMALTLLS